MLVGAAGLLLAVASHGAPFHHHHGAAVEQCLSSGARAKELKASDAAQARKTQASRTETPKALQDLLARLVRHARVPAGTAVRLVMVDSDRAAWVLSSGDIFVSTRLVNGPQPLQADEIAAVLAHEIAHLEASDIQHRLCEAAAFTGHAEHQPLSVTPAAMHQAIRAGDQQLAIRMMQSNHARELRADRRAAELLAKIGISPDAVARMLVKVTPPGAGDFSLSHPAIEARLENLGVSLH